jgi:glucokinase
VSEPIHCLGVDIGGTKTAAAVVTPDGRLLGLTQGKTPAAGGPDAVIGEALDVARAAMSSCAGPVAGCGIGTAGTVSPDGVITHATSALPGWSGTDVAGAFRQSLGMPVVVLNDVHAYAVGEGSHGAAAGFDDALIVAVGTGIGGGILHQRKLLVGASGSAGSIGHLPVVGSESRQCPCGRWNHLEAYASGPAIEARYTETTGQPIGLPAIATKARAGDAPARSVINEAATILGRTLGAAANVLDPEVIVIGGGVAALEDLITEPLLRGLASEALPGPKGAQLRFTTLGAAAVILGAASLVRSHIASKRPRR